jgi:hypothetical protein
MNRSRLEQQVPCKKTKARGKLNYKKGRFSGDISTGQCVTANTPAFFSNPTSSKGKLIEYIMHCQKKGFSDATTRTKSKILRVMINNNVNLNDPEAVKLFIAKR